MHLFMNLVMYVHAKNQPVNIEHHWAYPNKKKGMVRYLDKSEGEHLLRLVVLTVLTFKINLAHRIVTVVNSWAPGHYHPT